MPQGSGLFSGDVMKFSQLIELIQNYDYALQSPSRMHVKFGCDCGCGGNSYTTESWDEEERQANISIKEAILFCEKYGIEYDGVSSD
jgi:hypothetical protein